ncbi:MAG: ATP-binding protein [Candidatus Helarchaeota archaeon]
MITIGKFILESLTTGMYRNPMIIFREYIQNSTDAIDHAIEENILKDEDNRINIELNNNDIEIKDNGIGLQSKYAFSRLLDIGNSKKEINIDRGFRGIGRLGGLSYCKKLIFITSALGENKKSIVVFDCEKMRKLISPGEYENYDVIKVVEESSKYYTEDEDINSHFFKVLIKEVEEDYLELCDRNKVKEFLSENAPVPFDAHKFVFYTKIKNYFEENNYSLKEYKIYLNGNQIFKPFKSRFEAGRGKDKTKIEVRDVIFIKNDKLDYLLWYTKNDLLGSIKNNLICGIRLRKGNILIGDNTTLNILFTKSNTRFNHWFQGELHVFNQNLIPNARRDDFEKNKYYKEFLRSIKRHGDEFEKKCRDFSKKRNEVKKIAKIETKLDDIEDTLKVGFSSEKEKEKIVDVFEDAKAKIKDLQLKDSSIKEKKSELIERINKIDELVEFNADEYLTKLLSSYSRKEKKIIRKIFNIITEELPNNQANELIEKIMNKLLLK